MTPTYQLYQSLKSTLQEIEREKEHQFSWLEVAKSTWHESKKNTCKSIAKIVGFSLAVISMPTLFLGAVASLNSYRISSAEDLFSSNSTDVSASSQIYANAGHGIMYIVDGIEIVAISALWIGWKGYKRAQCALISRIYDEHLNNSSLSTEQRDYLFDLRQKGLCQYGCVTE